ncbi:MAG TPA: non-homologous end-joining DNA ligase [Pyrinomonadaceae bacterium]|nr:non-homologous end-joining DNA ligase [Pyrinomonadaceae bacterium]
MPRSNIPTREYHPAVVQRSADSKAVRKRRIPAIKLPKDKKSLELDIDGRVVKLTNLDKPFWTKLGVTKRDLIQYYADIAPALLPHLVDRAMVMKRYPNGASSEFFFMKRAPSPRPAWIEICSIEHSSGNIIDFPMIQDFASLLWVINLGCIDLNQWYARCDDVDRPDYLHFDLDPVPGASFEKVVEAALFLKVALDSLKIPSYAKTTGSKGIHIYVPIRRGPTQKQVWTFAKEFALAVTSQSRDLLTAVYQVSRRPKGRVLVDYNQNAWGRTLASVYSVRPKDLPTVSTPVTWKELEKGVEMDDFTIENVPKRVRRLGDLWKPLVTNSGRFRLEAYL